MSLPETIRTSRLHLRHWRPSDLEPFAALNADARVMEHFPSPLSRHESDAMAARIESHFEQRGFGLWAVEIPNVTAFAGFVGLNVPRFEASFTPCVEIGWRLAASYWGRGYATEGARAALAFAFEELPLDEVLSFTVPGNFKSRRVMEKIGMTHRPGDEFDHPLLPEGHPLRRHVLYRIGRPAAVAHGSGGLLAQVDHLVYATPDLERTVEDLERLLGVRATPGGQHPGRGTRNALIALGPASYLEVVGPDPAQPDVSRPLWFGIDRLLCARLIGWAAKEANLDHLIARAGLIGIQLGAVGAGSRRRADGLELKWRFTDPAFVVADGIVPFFIDWGASPHPATSAVQGTRLTGLRAEHPDAEWVETILRGVNISMPVERGASPALIARIQTARGMVELR